MRVRASSLERIRACPGSLIAADGLDSPDSAASLSGTIIHRALELWARGEDVPDSLFGDDRERIIYHWFRAEVQRIEDAHGGALIRLPELSVAVDVSAVTLSGHSDLAMQCGDGSVHLIDYKTGRFPATPAPRSIQLMAYTLLLHSIRPEWLPITAHIFSAGAEPEQRFTSCMYTVDTLEAAQAHIRHVISDALATDAPRRPGDPQCVFCPAYGHPGRCPETCKAVQGAIDDITTRNADVLPPPDQCAVLYDSIKAVERYSKPFLQHLKNAIAENPDQYPGFELQPGRVLKSTTDPQEACLRLIERGVTPDDIWLHVTISPAKIAKIVEPSLRANGMKAKDVKAWVSDTFADLIEEKQSAPILARKEERNEHDGRAERP